MSKYPEGAARFGGAFRIYCSAKRPAGAKVYVIWGLQNGHLLSYLGPTILGGLISSLDSGLGISTKIRTFCKKCVKYPEGGCAI